MTKQRTLYYRRFNAVTPNGETLQELIDKAHGKLLTTKQRSFSYSKGEIQGLEFEKQKNRTLLHVSFHIPGQPTSLVPKATTSLAGLTKEETPPQDYDYMEGDIFALIRKNHVVVCPSGVRDSILKGYISEVTGKIGFSFPFTLDPVANMEKITLLEQEGVKAILLNSSVYQATVDNQNRQTQKANFWGKISQEFLEMIYGTSFISPDELKKYENVSLKLGISFDSRKLFAENSKDRLTEIGKQIVLDEEDKFKILTNAGNKISPNDINISKQVDVRKHGKSVSKDDAFANLLEYFEELKKDGLLTN
ncbi:MAG: hypothetical protein PHV05_06755 [Candidatus Riflebacteria bacterium]|nr:hypothetical protein [Candidatus Riflebacteria bacterium]